MSRETARDRNAKSTVGVASQCMDPRVVDSAGSWEAGILPLPHAAAACSGKADSAPVGCGHGKSRVLLDRRRSNDLHVGAVLPHLHQGGRWVAWHATAAPSTGERPPVAPPSWGLGS